jgi:polyhydroxyalkanoate synthesis regulator protein
MRAAMKQTMGNFFPFGMEEVGRQNMAMMERAMSLFTPFRPAEAAKPAAKAEDEVTALKHEIERLRDELEAVKKKG